MDDFRNARWNFGLAGKRALVTGGGSGMGRAVCDLLAEQGVRVAAVGLPGDGVEEIERELSGAISIAADISDVDQVHSAYSEAVARFGQLDIVIHAAGVDDIDTKKLIADQNAIGAPIDILSTLTDEQWRRMIRINLDGSFYVLRAGVNELRKSGGGSIVAIGAEAGSRGSPGLPHYSASKGGQHALVRTAAKEAISYGVRVNGIAPGFVDTPMNRRFTSLPPENASIAPIGRRGEPSEIASVAVFLASDCASYIVGEIVNVDGGRMAS